MAASTLSWVNIFALITLIIVLIILLIIFLTSYSQLLNNGLSLRTILGTQTKNTDSFTLQGNSIYIGRSQVPLRLTLNKNNGNLTGQTAQIKNDSPNNILFQAGTANLGFGQLNSTLTPGQTSLWIAINDGGRWLRLT